MSSSPDSQPSREVFSFHLSHLPIHRLPKFLCSSVSDARPGPKHAERMFSMKLGSSITEPARYNVHAVACFAWWESDDALSAFLAQPEHAEFQNGWHVRMRLYRRWGSVSEISAAHVDPTLANPKTPVVAVTLARLKLTETARFIRWGRPVESQVRDHRGQRLALAAMRPLNTFSTFSIWQNESEMLKMVSGAGDHMQAMRERSRRDFHHEFTTLRFVPYFEAGEWDGRSGFTH